MYKEHLETDSLHLMYGCVVMVLKCIGNNWKLIVHWHINNKKSGAYRESTILYNVNMDVSALINNGKIWLNSNKELRS